jgi:hypothetical protein
VTRSPVSTSGIVQLVTRRARQGHPADSEFFTTWATLEQGDWQADKVSQLLQIAPSAHFGLRPFAQEFHVNGAVGIARSIASSNKQFGLGGGEKLFIPAAKHAATLRPVGDLIPLVAPEDEPPPEATGPIKRLLDLELSLGNTLVASDRGGPSRARSRFWLQDPIHGAEIAGLRLPATIRAFEDLDMHGKSTGYVNPDESQVVIGPFPGSPVRRSWLARLFS